MKYKNHSNYDNPIKFCGECGILPRYLRSPSGVRLWCGREDSDEGCHRVTWRCRTHGGAQMIWNDAQSVTENKLAEWRER